MPITYRKFGPKPQTLPSIDTVPGAKALVLTKKASPAEGPRSINLATPTGQSKLNAQQALDAAVKSGTIIPRDRPTREKDILAVPAILEDFGRLHYMGVPKSQVCEILKINGESYNKLKRQHLENTIEALADVGVLGMVALGFDKLNAVSDRTMQLIAALGDKEEDRQDLMSALRLLKDTESEKINLLVKTGAIKVKKKIEVSAQMEILTGGTKPILTGEKAAGTMVHIMTKLTEAMEEEEDAEIEE